MVDNATSNRDQLLARIRRSWEEMNAYLGTLNMVEMTELTDAGGWTAKDHVANLVVWELGVVAMLDGKPRFIEMGLPEHWKNLHYEEMNAIMHRQHKDRPYTEIMAEFRQVHSRLIAAVEKLSDADLQRPYHELQPDSDRDDPIIETIISCTYDHYTEHRPWIEAIVHQNR